MQRLQKFREKLTALNIEGMLIANRENCRYLSGFSGSSGMLLVGLDQAAYLITDFRYWEQAKQEAPDFCLFKQKASLGQSLQELLRQLGWQRVGFEAKSTTYQEYQDLKTAFSGQLVATTELVEQERLVKSSAEINCISKAEAITGRAWEEILPLIKPGISEQDLALEFDYQLRRNGAEGNAFPTIVAFGGHSALPHATPTNQKLMAGDLVLIDGGGIYQGYRGDLTRTVVCGKANQKQRELYDIVLRAQKKALGFLQAGLISKEVDQVARDFITASGYGDYFGHSLGHGVGLNVHEEPRLSSKVMEIIPKNAVVTVEPGIYLPGFGGVRIEDLVVVTNQGITNLTFAEKDILIEL